MLCALRRHAALINLRGVLTKRNHHPPPPASRPRPDAVRIRTLTHTHTHTNSYCLTSFRAQALAGTFVLMQFIKDKRLILNCRCNFI
jgi:hypothetical protein